MVSVDSMVPTLFQTTGHKCFKIQFSQRLSAVISGQSDDHLRGIHKRVSGCYLFSCFRLKKRVEKLVKI